MQWSRMALLVAETSWRRPVGVVLPQGGSPDIPIQVEHMHKAGHAIRQRVAGYSPSVEAARKRRSDGQTVRHQGWATGRATPQHPVGRVHDDAWYHVQMAMKGG